MNRRFFMKSGGVALASFGALAAAPSFMERAVLARGKPAPNAFGKRKTLVAIFMRGAVDGLNVVAPYGESNYYNLRPNLALPKPNGGNQALLNLDGFFGLNPALAPLKQYWDSKQLAIVHAVGSPDSTRSHFDAQDYMESGTPGRKGTSDGWLNRILQNQPEAQNSPFRAVSLTQNLPRSLYGKAPAVAMSNIADFGIRGGSQATVANVQGGFEAIYGNVAAQATGGGNAMTAQRGSDVLQTTGQETFEAVNFLRRVNPAQYAAENGAQYPNTPFGNSLRQIAQLIKAGVGLEIAFTDVGGWDTHANEGNIQGQLSNLLRGFGAAINAFVTDLGKSRMDDVALLTMSEFGRTARENGTRGTDHGHANFMFALGNQIRGGKVYGDWPGLNPDQLNEGRDLALTTDFRNVFGEVATKHLGVGNPSGIFPNYALTPAQYRGLMS